MKRIREIKKSQLKIIALIVLVIWFPIIIYNFILINPTDKVIQVKKGDTFHQIANDLSKLTVLKSRFFFIAAVKLTGQGSKLKAGYYKIHNIRTVFGLISKLTKGKIANKVFTIPEGYNVYQIGDILQRRGVVKKDDFLKAVKNRQLLKLFGINQNTAEGFLYPDTYYVPYEITAKQLVEIMIANFYDHIDSLYLAKLKERYGSIEKGVIVASLVEWEAQVDFERPIIAGVFLNRIKKNLNLGSCATVMYALNHHKSRLLFKDLKVDSPYNTYKYKGLPPTPICNPSEKSILAVIYPAKVDYLYFVSMQNGRHFFSNNYKRHLRGYRYFILNERDANPFVF